jgi:signal-transduction protein with cAMP-binding, CBS, and nucleotidyltransferase domain
MHVDTPAATGRNSIMTIGKSVKEVKVVALKLDPPVVLEETASVRDVLRQMQDKRCGYALLCREGRLSGIFTERDVLNKVVDMEGALDQPVSELMTRDPVCLHEKDPIRKAVLHMYRDGFRSLPILDDDGEIITCVRHKDIVHYLVEHFAHHVLHLPPDPDNVPKTPEGG